MKVEEHRLIDWARSVRVDFTDHQLLLNHMSKGLIIGILEQQQKLLISFGRLDESYRALKSPGLVETEVVFEFNSDRLLESGDDTTIRFPQTDELIEKVRVFTNKLKIAPRKLQWAINGEEKMTALVNNLIHFNDKLNEVLDKAQRDSLFEMQTRTNYQIVLLNQNVENLMQIIQAQRIQGPSNYLALPYGEGGSQGPYGGNAIARNSEARQLAGLAQFKAINLQIEGSSRIDEIDDTFARQIDLNHSASDIRHTQIALNEISPEGFPEDLDEERRTPWQYEGKNVWIEWKAAEPTHGPTNGAGTTHERISKLAALLKEMNKTVKFRAPECLGYFDDEEYGRYGFVFAKPESIPNDEEPTTLHSLLSGEMPPLADRITIMRLVSETVERLHAVDWLHKGLRSANILFFKDPTTHAITFADPYISGFEYSRPAARDDMTQRPSDDLAADIYRHPSTQSDTHRSGFRKSFDLYALGIVLLEIAHWKPIDAILGIDMRTARPRDIHSVRDRLLGDAQYRKYVRSFLGTTVESVVWACLEGPVALGLPADCETGDAQSRANLQWEFGRKVVEKLAQMKGL
jgi:hypothetical protein